jgi:hypothetical protein
MRVTFGRTSVKREPFTQILHVEEPRPLLEGILALVDAPLVSSRPSRSPTRAPCRPGLKAGLWWWWWVCIVVTFYVVVAVSGGAGHVG